MDSELLRLNTSEHMEELRKYVEGLSVTYVSTEVPKILTRNDGANVIQIFLSNLCDSPFSQEKKLAIAELVVKEIEKQGIGARVGEKLMNVLASELDSLPSYHLLRLVDICCNMIQSPSSDSSFACWKELLPRLLLLIVEKPWVEHHGSEITGLKYKSCIVSSLLVTDWDDSIVVDLAAMFVDVPLDKEELHRVVRKMCSLIPSLPADLIPPFTHQLIQLTKNDHSLPLLLVLSNYFKVNLYDKIHSGELGMAGVFSEVEGTTVYHIVNSCGSVGVKELKTFRVLLSAPNILLQPFHVTLLLAMSAASPAAEENTMAILRSAFTRAIAESDRLNDSAWIRSVSPEAFDVERLIRLVLENCNRGRDTVLKGLVSLGFALLGTGKGRGREDSGEKLRGLGVQILEELVKRHRLVTATVLQTLANFISQAQDALHYIECLLVLSKKQPLRVLDCSGLLLQLLDNLCGRLPGPVVSMLLSAVLPLSRMSQGVRDNLVMLLRKSLFPHDVERRILAVRGFLELLRDLKISNLQSLSQSMSQNYCNFTQLCSQSLAGGASQSNEGLCLEVLSILKEVFKQQHQVKTVLYRGIYGSVRGNPVLAPHVLDHLQTHFMNYYKEDATVPPLLFHNAVLIKGADVVLVEPLGDFILCLSLLVAKLEDSSLSAKLQEMLMSLCERMAACDVRALRIELDDGSNILEPTVEGLKMQEVVRQVLGVYEALIGFILCSWKKWPGEQATQLWSLFKSFTCLSDYARGLGKGERKKGEGKKGKLGIFKFPQTVLNLKCVARLIALINNAPLNWADAESAAMLRGKRELHRYALQTSCQLVQHLATLPAVELSRDCLVVGYLCKIARIVYSKYMSCLSEVKAFDLTSAVSGLQCFFDIMSLMLTHFKTKFFEFLQEIVVVSLVSQASSPLESIVETLVNQTVDVLSDEDTEDEAKEDVQAKKMCALFLSLLGCLAGQLPSNSLCIRKVYDKIKDTCRNSSIEKPGVAKPLLSLLLALHRRCEESDPLILDLALCLCDCVPLIDDEMEVDEHTRYKVINQRTGNVSLVAICDHLHLMLSDIEFIVARLKAEAILLPLPSAEPLQQRKDELREKEEEVCREMNTCAKAISALCTLAVPPGVYSDSVLKALELVYNKLTLLTKYFMLGVTKFEENVTSAKFDRTVRLVDAELTKNMYCFTEHVIADGSAVNAKNVNPNLLKQRSLKETKLIPRVIFEKEQFHKFLLQLSKRAKIDLASKTKHAMARDYRLYARQVRDLLEKENAQPGTELMDSEEQQECPSSPSSPSSKRCKLDSSQSTEPFPLTH